MDVYCFDQIKDYKKTIDGEMEFLVKWEGCKDCDTSWVFLAILRTLMTINLLHAFTNIIKAQKFKKQRKVALSMFVLVFNQMKSSRSFFKTAARQTEDENPRFFVDHQFCPLYALVVFILVDPHSVQSF